MISEKIEFKLDYTKAKLPFGTPENFNPKKEDFIPTLETYVHDDLSLTEFKIRKRPAVVVVPGGGYHFVSKREGDPVAAEFFAAGFQSFVFTYSVAPTVFPASLMELATAVKYVRSHAEEWNIDPDKIIICGFSAGGHLCGSLSTMWNEPFLAESIDAKPEEFKPNGAILSYPVISSGLCAHRGSFNNLLAGLPEELKDYTSLENRVTEATPRTFLWSTWTDQLVPIKNSLLYAEALADAGVNCEVHIFPEGRHGLSLATEYTAKDPRDIVDEGLPNPQIVPRVEPWIQYAREWVRKF